MVFGKEFDNLSRQLLLPLAEAEALGHQTEMQRLDLSSVAVAHLIEASAGTGKTYTISGLVLRLVLEYELGIDRTPVVTYTEAAAAELRQRIRSRLSQARAVFAAGERQDSLLRALLAACPDRDLARRRLTYAIHGFCERVLRNQAFESGTC